MIVHCFLLKFDDLKFENNDIICCVKYILKLCKIFSVYGKKPDADDTNSDTHEGQYVNINSMLDVIHAQEEDSIVNIPVQTESGKNSTSTTPRKISEIQMNSFPRIVLRRLSTLTYPGIKGWKSPPQETKNSLTSDPEPSSSGISVSSKSPTDEINPSSPDFSETEICSTPKPSKIPRLSKENDNI